MGVDDEWWIINKGGKQGVLQKPTVVSQEIFLALLNLKSDDLVHKSRPLVRILSPINPVYSFPQYFFKIHCKVVLFRTFMFWKDLISSHFLTKTLYVFFFPMNATHPSYFPCSWCYVPNYFEMVNVAAQSKAWTVFARSDAGIVGSNPTQGMDV
jgi:hypothetical protein